MIFRTHEMLASSHPIARANAVASIIVVAGIPLDAGIPALFMRSCYC
jgi:hypothetical protein